MSSQENLCTSEIKAEPSETNANEKDVKPNENSEKAPSSENIELYKNGTKDTAVVLSSSPSNDSEIEMQSDINDFMEVQSPDKYETECVTSFRLEFSYVNGISTVSPTKAWIQGTRNLKLVDIEKNKVLRSYYSNIPFWNLCGIDENTVLFTTNNSIIKFQIHDDNSTDVKTVLNMSEGHKPAQLNVLRVSKSGDIIACVTRKLGCACCAREVSFIERYDGQGKLLTQAKIESKGKYLIRDPYEIIQNNNGDICIAGEKVQKKFEFWVVVLDSELRFKFSYDRNTTTQIHVPSSLAIDTANNIVVVNNFRDRTKIRKNSLTNKKKKELTYIALIDENGIFRQHVPTDGFISEGSVVRLDIDSKDKAWIATDSGQIIVWDFKNSAKNDQDGTDTKT